MFPWNDLVPGWHWSELQSMNQNLILSTSDGAWEALAYVLTEQYTLLSYGNCRVPFSFPFFFLQPVFPTPPPVLFIPKHAVHKYICALAHVYSISKCILKWLSITVLSYKVEAAQYRITYWLCFWQSSSKYNNHMSCFMGGQILKSSTCKVGELKVNLLPPPFSLSFFNLLRFGVITQASLLSRVTK